MLRILNLVFLGLFILSAAVQYNDSDPIRWMAIYLSAAAACVLAMYRPVPRWLTAITALVALGWIAILLPRVFGQVGLSEMFKETGMATMEIEEGREAIGLLLVVLWMTALLIWPHRIRRSTAPTQAQL